jgi:hypothetical protein
MTSYHRGDRRNGSCQSIGPTFGPNQVGSYRIKTGFVTRTVFSQLFKRPCGDLLVRREAPSLADAGPVDYVLAVRGNNHAMILR